MWLSRNESMARRVPRCHYCKQYIICEGFSLAVSQPDFYYVMPYLSKHSYTGSLFLSPAILSRPPSPDHPWRILLQEARNHLHNLGRVEHSITQSSKIDGTHTRELALREAGWAEWLDEYYSTLREYRDAPRKFRSEEEDVRGEEEELRQIRVLLTVNDFKIEACRSRLRATVSTTPATTNVRRWVVRKLSR
ncbi:hypothetical protein BDY19DRAFT_912373 [Irpex rosettiformis]|uniref:Uncharacterized protein n=1 Tax=Irpex rosettiformis TaxID=378272 RepID=A0ACB8UIZ0_9APHY|nr:hypothetical protein BDY19DRAFT_912373 [Irpex rosettiformis]